METNELLERYVYDVARRLPQNQRADVSQELRGLAEDMLEERGASLHDFQALSAVLTELGEPRLLAEKYRGEKKGLIGPENIDTYWLALRIVLICSGVGIVLAKLIEWFTQPADLQNMGALFFGLVVGVLSGLMNAFAVVTLIFIIAERVGKEKMNIVIISGLEKTPWTPEALPPVPSEKAMIKRSEPIAGIVFSVFFLVFFNAAPGFLGAIFIDGAGTTVISIFNASAMWIWLPLINACLVVEIIQAVILLCAGRYSLKLACVKLALNLVSMALTVLLFSNSSLWNNDFVSVLSTTLVGAEQFVEIGFRIFRTGLFPVIMIAFVAEIASDFVRGVRADKKSKM